MSEVASQSVQLCLTAPDFTVDFDWLREVSRVLSQKGFFIVNCGTPYSTWGDTPDVVLEPYRKATLVIQESGLVPRLDIVLAYDVQSANQWIANPFSIIMPATHEHFFVFTKNGEEPYDYLKRNLRGLINPTIIAPANQRLETYETGIREGTQSAFDEKVVQDLIRAFSREGELLLDPMGGIGTLAKLAAPMGRNVVLYEINPNSVRLAKEHLKEWL